MEQLCPLESIGSAGGVRCLAELSSKKGEVSRSCLDELDFAVPFVCAKELAELRCLTTAHGKRRKGRGHQTLNSDGEGHILQCLEDHMKHLSPRCADVALLARDHFVQYPGHEETSFNLYTPDVKRRCKEALKIQTLATKGCQSHFCSLG